MNYPFMNWNRYVFTISYRSLATEGAMCTFHTFEKNTFKDLQAPEKSGLQYKCLVLILRIVYECSFK